MSVIEGILFWISIGAYFACFVLYLTDAVFRKDRAGRIAWTAFVCAFVVQTLTIGWRWYLSGRVPVMVSYEHYQIGAWFVGLSTLAGSVVYPRMRILSLPAAAVIIFLLGIGVSTPSEMAPMRPPFKSNWLFVHIGFAWFAVGCFVMATILAAVYLLKSYRTNIGPVLQKFPSLEVMDELMIKFVIFGFICQGLSNSAGAIWAHQLWGRYWSWDPIETWSLVIWLVYGLVLHLRLMMGWKGVSIAVAVLLAIVTVVVTFWGIGFMPQSHTTLMLTK